MNLFSSNNKKLKELIDMRNQKNYILIYQILMVILLKKFIKLNTKMDIIMENVKYVQLNTKIVSAALNTHTLKMN